MAISFVAAGAVVTGANPTVAVPAGYAEKDLLVIVTTGTATPTTPAGWTSRGAQGLGVFLTIFYKFASGTESSVTLTVAGAATKAVMLAYNGVSAADTITAFAAAASTSVATAALATTYANEYVISVFASNIVAATWTAPASTTTQVNSSPTATVNGLLIVDEAKAASGAGTARTATISSSHTLAAVGFSIIPSGRYWRGGTGTWTTTTTNWSFSSGGAGGAPAPTANDLVTFDQAATYTVTLTGALTCFGMTVSDGTVTFSSTGTIANSGSMSLVAGTVWSATGLVTFNSTSTGRTVTTNGVTINSPLTFSGVGGVWSLGSALSTGVTLTTTLISGTLTLNGFDLTTGIFSSSAATARSIAFGTNNIVLSHTTAATVVLSMATATLFTTTGTTGGFTATAAITRTFTFGTTGGTATNAPNLSLTGSGTAVQTLTTASWFNNLSFGTTAFNPGTTALNLNGLTLSSGGTFTTLSATMRGTGTITPAGKTIAAFTVNNGAGTVTLAAALGVTTYTQTAGTIDFATFNLTCSGAVAYTAGTLNNIGTISCTTWTVTGAFTLSGGTITPSVSFVLTSGSFTYSSGTLSAVPTFTHTAGTVTLGQNYSLTSTGTYTLVAGTLTMTDRNLTAAAFITSGTGVRAIIFGTSGYGEITVTGNNVTVWDGGGANITYTGTPRIYASYTGSVGTRTVNLGTAWTEATAFDVTVQAASYYFISGFQILSTGGNPTDTVAISGVAKKFDMVNFSFAVTPGTMTIYGDYNIPSVIYTGTINASASTTTFATTSSKNISISRSIDFPITFSGVGGTFNITASLTTGATRAMTLTAGSLVLDGSSSISTGTFLSTGTGTRSINFNNNNITLTNTVAATTVLSMADATNFTIAGTGGFVSDLGVTKTFSFGSTAGGATTNAPNLTFTTGAAIPTITTGSWFNSLNFGSTTSTPAATTIFVSTLTLASGGTYTGLTPTFTSTQTWTPQFSKQLAGLGVNIPGGTLTLGGSQSLIATATTTLTAGSLDLNGNDLTTGIFSSSNTNTRAIAFGSNNINLTHTTAAQTVLAMATATGFSLTGTGGFVSNLTVTRTFQFGSTAGGSETNSPNLAITSGAAIPTITTNSWFNALDFTGTTAIPAATTVFVSTLTLATGGTYTAFTPIFTRTQTWTTQFSKELGGIGFNLAGGTLTLGDSPAIVDNGTTTLTAGTLDLNGFNIGTGIFSSSNTNTRSIAFGSNSILCTSHTTAATTVLNMAIATGFTWTGTGKFFVDAAITRTAVFGTTGGTATNAPNLAVSGTGIAIVTLTTGSWFNDLSFTTTAFALPATTLNIAGDLTLSSGGTFASLTLNTVGTGSILSNGKTIAAFTINSVSGTTTLGDALSLVATGTTTLTSGALVLNDFTLATGIFSSSNTNTRSIAFGTGNIVLSTTTLALVNLSMATATNFTYTSSGTYGSGTGVFQSTMSVTRTFTFGTTGGSAANAPRLYLVSGASIPTITTNSWFSEIDFGTTAFTIAATNLNLSSLKSNLSTSVLTALTATMVGTGSIRTNTSIGPLIINTSAITTTLAGTTLCTTAALTQGTLDLAGQTLTCSSTFTYNGGSLLTASGALNCTTFTINGPAFDFTTGTITPSTSFVLTSGSFTLNGGTLSAVPAFTHTAGTVTFNTSYSLTATGTYTFTAGTLTLADGVTLSTGIFSSTNTNTRSIAFGAATAGYISLTHTTAATTRLSMAIATGFTESGPGGFTSSMGVTATFTFGTTGGSSSNAPNLLITGGAAIPTFTTGGWFNLLDFTGSTSTPAATVLNLNALTLASGGTYTALGATMVGTGTITPNGKTIAAFVVNTTGTATLAGALGVTTYTQTEGTIDFATFNLTCSGAAAYTSGTLNNIGTISCTTWTVTGAFTFGQGTITPSTSFVLTSGSFTYNSGATLSAVPTFTHTAGTVTLNQSYALTTTGTYTLTAGTLTLADGVTLTTGIFSSNNSNTRSVAFGSASASNINLTHTTAATTVLAMNTITGFTFTGTGGFTVADMSNTRTFTIGSTAGGSVTNAVNLTFTTGASLAAMTSGSWYNNLDFGSASMNATSTSLNIGGNLTLSSSGTFTSLTPTMLGTGTITSNAKTIAALTINTTGTITLGSALALIATGTTTLTSGALVLNGFDLTTGIFSSSNTNTRSIAFGTNNIGLVHTTLAQTVLNMAILTNYTSTGTPSFTSDASVTRTFVFGTTGGSATNAPNLSLTGSGTAIATFTTGSWFDDLNFGTTAFNPGTTALSIAGSLTLSSGGTFTALTPTIVGTGTITSNGKTIPALIVNTTGTATLAGTLTVSGAITLTQGTLACSTFSVTSATFASTGSLTRSMGGSSTYTITGAGATAFSNASATGITIDGLTISMTAATAKTFAGGGGSFATLNQGGAGALTISGNNSFDDLTATTRPSTITFTASSTQTFNFFTLSGLLGSLITINSSAPGTQAILSKASGTVSASFLSIRDSDATGGAAWYAGTTSTNVSNNLGWIFTAPPAVAYAGNFFAFF